MRKWKSFVQINGVECSFYKECNFSVTDEEYTLIQKAIHEKRLLREFDFYGSLVSAAEHSIDLEDYLYDKDDIPEEDDFDDREEYEEAYSEYIENHNALLESFFVVDVNIYDPTEEIQFKQHFIGNRYNIQKGIYNYKFYEDGERIVTYSLNIHFDSTGTITDITDIEAEGLESETIKYTKTGNAYPDYCLLVALMEEQLKKSKMTMNTSSETFYVTVTINDEDYDTAVEIEIDNEEYQFLLECCREEESIDSYIELSDLAERIEDIALESVCEQLSEEDLEDIDSADIDYYIEMPESISEAASQKLDLYEYQDYPFAMEVVNGGIINMSSQLQNEVLTKILKITELNKGASCIV